MTTYQRAMQKDWLGGQNSDFADDSVGKNEAILLSNLSLMERPNSLVQVSGPQYFTTIGALPEDPDFDIHFLFPFYKSNDTTFNMVSYSELGVQKIGYFNSSGVFTNVPSSNPIALAVTDSVSFEGNVYFVNGTNTIYSWDGAAANLSEDAAPLSMEPAVIEMFNNRAYFSGDPTYRSRFFYSEQFLPTDFESPFLAFEDVSDSDNDRIEDLRMLGPNLVVMKTRSIHTVIQSPPQEIRPNEEIGIGCIDRRSTQKTNYGLMFLSARGVYLYNGRKPIRLTAKIDSEIREAYAASGDGVSSAYYKNRYYIFFKSPATTGVSQGYVFNLSALDIGLENVPITFLDNFELETNMVINDETWYAGQSTTSNILLVSTEGRKTYYKDTANPEEPLVTLLKSRWEEFGDITKKKDIRYLYFTTNQLLLNTTGRLIYDYEGRVETYTFNLVPNAETQARWNEVKWNEFLWGPNVQSIFKITLPPGIVCNRARIELESTDAEEFFALEALEYHFLTLREI